MKNERQNKSFFTKKSSDTDRRESTGSVRERSAGKDRSDSRGERSGSSVPRASSEDRKLFMGKREDSPRGKRDDSRGKRDDSTQERRTSRRDDAPQREYKPNERKPRPLRGQDKPKERSPFSRQAFAGDSDTYSQRLDSARKPKKPTVRPKGAAPVKITNPNEPLRLNRFIAQSGVCSRREADELILSGEVTVNGVVVKELGVKVERSDKVEFQGKQLRGEKKVYIIMNKPKGFVTSVDDPHNDRTIMDLLKGEVPQRVYPVGRLDKYTTGVILLTNDGDLTKELTHPSYEKSKIYHVFLDKPITEAHLEELFNGVTLEDGDIKADEIATVGGNRKEVGIELHSGRNRIVRRMFEHLGYEVERLDRVYFAGLTKVGLRRGFWRYLTESEVAMLKSKNYR